MNQESISKINQVGWNQSVYQAWVNRHGLPNEYAQKLKSNPIKAVSYYIKYMGDVRDKKIANLLGSKGNKAVSFALLGADVTVVDISKENRRYAMELANQAEVNIKYIVSDLLEIPEEDKLADFDFIVLELGVLHYFVDLMPLFNLVRNSLKSGGKFILRDYHPFASKLMNLEGSKMIANGDYFETELVDVDVAYSILLSENERAKLTKNKIRRWTLGEIVTSIAKADLNIEILEEESGIRWAFPFNSPEGIENKIPGLFTIIANK